MLFKTGVFRSKEVNPSAQEGSMKLAFRLMLSAAVFLCLTMVDAAAEEFAGLVKSVEGQAFLLRGSETEAVVPGMEIKMGDILKTGDEGAVGLIFSDDTVIAMGPRTELAVEDYLFEPVEGKLSFIAKILRGTISYLSGQIAKLSPESVKLVTPAATIGVRGTHVLIKVD
jgi:hypothetical protein